MIDRVIKIHDSSHLKNKAYKHKKTLSQTKQYAFPLVEKVIKTKTNLVTIKNENKTLIFLANVTSRL